MFSFAPVTRWLVLLALIAGCTRFGPVYPPRPAERPSPLVPESVPSRITLHVSVTGAALRQALDASVPATGEGTVNLLGSERAYHWRRSPLDVSFAGGRVLARTLVTANVDMPIGSIEVGFSVQLSAEPVINTNYEFKLQGTDVKVQSDDRRLRVLDQVAGVFERVGAEIDGRLRGFSYALKPLLEGAYDRVRAPLPFSLGDASGCAELKVLGLEAAPLILADGVEKDFALIVAPSVTIPCAAPSAPEPLPPLENVASVPTGPFTVTIPVVASYGELTRGLSAAFTNGKLFFSKEHPYLYLEKPELYESDGALVLHLHIGGPVHELGIHALIDGELYLTGHPSIVDNEITLPDLEPTIETSNFLLSLKALTGAERIKTEARRALRVDLTERLAAVRAKLSSDLTFRTPMGCVAGYVDQLELAELHPHGAYLRAHGIVTARASASMPCATEASSPAKAAPGGG
jgi:hypothetical protein